MGIGFSCHLLSTDFMACCGRVFFCIALEFAWLTHHSVGSNPSPNPRGRHFTIIASLHPGDFKGNFSKIHDDLTHPLSCLFETNSLKTRSTKLYGWNRMSPGGITSPTRSSMATSPH
ncbi:uncharacterized protein LOC117305186 [Asterias rubens]|uniref:uncharacterized protein LOC117305186 n=1 Tax=Asterias rubens TaxID=7604 RepID=UPI0014551C71|nr:uncharacterized protein LOC117305186 [Asterias rubens]